MGSVAARARTRRGWTSTTPRRINAAAAQKHAVSGIPHIEFLSPAGKSLGNQVGSSSRADFAGTLQKMLAKSK